MKIITSVGGVPIRLTDERKRHIEFRHPEMKGQESKILETLSEPDYIQKGDRGSLIAVRHYLKTPMTRKFCVVVYKELSDSDGFVLTAYFTTGPAAWRETVWKP